MAYNKQRSSGFKNGRPLGGDKQFTPGKAQGRTDRQGGKRPEERGDRPYQRADGSGIGAPRQDRRPPREDRPGRPAEEFRAAPIPAPAAPVEPAELPLILYGRNPVREAIKSGRSIDKLLVTAAGSEDGSLREIVRMARERNIIVSEVARQKLDELCLPYGYAGKSANHQGVVARVPECQYVELDDILAAAQEKGQPPFVLVLDSINDPHNLGSIIRSAECAGVHGVIIPKRRAASVTGAVAKASAGAVAYMPIARVPNLTAAVERLKKEGLWVCGADMGGTPMTQAPLSGPLALVIGGEDEGISRLLKEKCDFIASIPLLGEMTSLNASVAAALLMYEKIRQDGR